jgi:hypothetical protein
MQKSIEYRTNANECTQLALSARAPTAKRMFEDTARFWGKLADGLEKYEARLGPKRASSY